MRLYETKYRIGTSSTGKDGKVTLISALDIIQDCSLFWMESEPVFTKYLNDHNVGLFITYRHLEVVKRPNYGDNVTLCTGIYECKKFFGYRNTVLYNDKKEPCFLSWSVGAFVDLATNKIVSLPMPILKSITYDEKVEMDYSQKKIVLPNIPYVTLPELQMRRNDIDIYGHMNNARYIELAMETLPNNFEVSSFRVEYKKSALYGDVFLPKLIKESDEKYFVILEDNNNNLFSLVEFHGKQL